MSDIRVQATTTIGQVLGGLCVLTWLYLVLLHGRFWRLIGLPLRGGASPAAKRRIAVVIPARNEADVIGRAVASLLGQRSVEVHIIVVDDNSEDGTGEAARSAAESAGRAESVTVVQGRRLEHGWTGKLWAMHQGVERALPMQPDFLLLTDADIEHGPEMVSRLAALAEEAGYDLASLMVKLHCRSAAEKLLIPAFVFFFFLLYPPRWIASAQRRVAGAAGGCMLVRPEALVRAGGIAAIRGEIIDDCALARAVKRSGRLVWLGTTAETRSLRAYESFAEIEKMIARTAFNQLKHSAALLAGATLGLALAYLLPVALLFGGRKTALPGATVLGLMFVSYLPMVRFYGLSATWALTLPASATFYLWATWHSAVKYWTGRGGEWKGRAQDAGRR